MYAQPIRKVRKAVFPVAGLGTRFLPATKVLPKEMLILGDRPLIQHAFEEARAAGIEEFVFVSSRHKGLIESHFKPHPELFRVLESRNKFDELERLRSGVVSERGLHVTYQDQPLGLGHAVWCAKEFIGEEPFVVILPDDVILAEKGCLSQMMEAYTNLGGNIVAVENVPRAETSRYGVLDVGQDNGKTVEVKGLVEKPDPKDAPSTLTVIGRYILQPEIFGYLSEFERGKGGEIQLTDSMAKLIGRQPFHGVRFEGRRFDCGSSFGLFEATVSYALQDSNIKERARRFLEGAIADVPISVQQR